MKKTIKTNNKMYIILKDVIPDEMAPTCAAHAAVACYIKYKDNPDTKEWEEESFRKVVCKVNDSVFQKLKKYEDYIIQGENKIGPDLVLCFRPRSEWPNSFSFLSLWTPTKQNQGQNDL